jgi:hypothetical protein
MQTHGSYNICSCHTYCTMVRWYELSGCSWHLWHSMFSRLSMGMDLLGTLQASRELMSFFQPTCTQVFMTFLRCLIQSQSFLQIFCFTVHCYVRSKRLGESWNLKNTFRIMLMHACILHHHKRPKNMWLYILNVCFTFFFAVMPQHCTSTHTYI